MFAELAHFGQWILRGIGSGESISLLPRKERAISAKGAWYNLVRGGGTVVLTRRLVKKRTRSAC
jgi:hypothetical protein